MPAMTAESLHGLEMDSVLPVLGAGTNDILAAFLGSCCGAFMLTQPTPRAVIATVFIGTCVGTYFGPNIPALIGMKPANWITLVIGSIGTTVLMLAGSWFKKKFNNGNGNGDAR